MSFKTPFISWLKSALDNKTLTGTLYTLVGLAITGLISRLAFMPSKGLDLTDEGLYLAALYAPRDFSWGFPFGWHISPAVGLIGEEISEIRFFFSWIMLSLFLFLGFSTSVFLKNRIGQIIPIGISKLTVLTASASLIFGVTFYDGMINRTPSYNWVNLAGILISVGATLLLLSRQGSTETAGEFIKRFVFITLVSVGSVYSIPGKPSTFVFVLVSLFIGLLVFFGVKRALVETGLATLLHPVLAYLFVFIGIWPANFMEIFSKSASQPSLTSLSGRSPFAELVGELRFPFELLANFWSASPLLVITGLAVFLALVSASARGKSTIIFAIVLTATIVQVAANGPLKPMFFDANVTLPTALTAWAYFFMAVAISVGYLIRNGTTKDESKSLLFLIFIFLGALFSYGFGSASGVFGKTSTGAVFIFLATCVLAYFASQGSGSQKIASVFLFGLISISLLTYVDSVNRPYRDDSFLSQQSQIDLERGGKLTLSEQRKNEILEFEQMLQEADIGPNDEVVTLLWRWSSTLPVVSGVNLFPTHMPTLFDYPGSLEALSSNLDRASSVGYLKSDQLFIISNNLEANPDLDKTKIQAARNIVIQKYGAASEAEIVREEIEVGQYTVHVLRR